MDSEYTMMCRAAKELQNHFQSKKFTIKHIEGERIVWKGWSKQTEDNVYLVPEWDDYIDLCNPIGPNPFEYENRAEYIWLPWQEDIQKLSKENLKQDCDGCLYILFDNWLKEDVSHYDLTFNQAWLCFYMETCYNKVWDSESGVWKVKP